MSSLNISEVLDKLDELQSLFELGQKTMPFLEELFHFIEDIEPLLDEVNSSIRESTHKMPHAKSKLQSVSEATELATTEILDLVDAVMGELQMVSAALKQATGSLDAAQAADEKMMDLLRSELPDDAGLLQQVEHLHAEKCTMLDECHRAADEKLQAVKTIREKMTQIMMALQVQDITSQQIAAVNHIIESLRNRMVRLIEHPSVSAVDAPETQLESDGTFDLDARYEPSGDHQSLADELVNSFQQQGTSEGPSDASDGEVASQEDIDELFG